MFSPNVQPKRFVSALRSECEPLQRWEDEGGKQSADGAPEIETRGERAAAGLSWSEFLGRFFPGRRRHDLEALEAYAAYRSESAPAPSTVVRLPAAVAKESTKGATS